MYKHVMYNDNDNDNILFDHNLQIEITIYNSTTSIIENEFHFLFKCNVYANLIQEMYSNAENNRNGFSDLKSEDTLLYLMKYECKLVSVYIEAKNVRNDII